MSQPTIATKPPINWPAALMLLLTFAIVVTVVPWYLLTNDVGAGPWIVAALFLAANELSITGGYHRLWAHRTYSAHWTVRLFYMLFGGMALQNSVLIWASSHRVHHINVDDTELDPYSAKRGFWFSHVGWMLRNYRSGTPDLSNVKDLQRDPLLAFQHEHYLLVALGTNFGFTLLAGWLIGDVWGTFWIAGFLRLVVQHHFTFFINSLAHMWGKQPYTDTNTARDNPVLAVLTFGEGYHNFHHIFAHDYRNGVRWWQWDPTKWMIGALAGVGLARNLKRVPNFQIQRAVIEMQLKRAQARLEGLRNSRLPYLHIDLDDLHARLSHEYEAFRHAIAEWARVKEEWYEQQKRALAQRWEETGFHARLLEIERTMRAQRKRMRLLHADLAYAVA